MGDSDKKNKVPKQKTQEAAKRPAPGPLPSAREYADYTPSEFDNATKERQVQAMERNNAGTVYSVNTKYGGKKIDKVLGTSMNPSLTDAEINGADTRVMVPRLNKEKAARTDRTTKDPFKKGKGK